MSNIDKQAVQAVADLKAGYTLGHADVAILNELARIALASLEAEPVCVIDQSNLDYLNSGSDADVWPASRKEMGDVLLYRTAPPAPVSVPDAATAIRECMEEFPESVHDIVEECAAIAENACRAAMLQGAAGNSPVIPDGWVLVPEEPTHEMLEAGDEQFGTYDVYRRMIAASPQQEVK
ncbi:hypothetical protein ACVGXN_05850 [Enterobacter hormaechei]|jgi:hypothetical protein|uniref:hypothetical protein n=1 Tax=Enterobacter hormaechei TaxID=158836 RepID=UPI00079A08EE|nr:hypothetical protein [Enterobacter hormaechei]MBU5512736.1 hypothetical protein [Enterobacteriaceae bacterium S18_ASV_15]MBU5541085.1 hypothetical protein [Pluralibacter sp. S10_ASV_43]MBU5634607.1 hypothetical protein [Enterobacteriaceae bacterium S29_ASV_15]MBU5652245.1 hypothetical protein [Enterobacteriaceae bacterium S22_ASV_15]HDX5074274.1 hypothetical protein [Enterobacter hormaechei subsp. steigerwaltii]